jgi:formamidopyrimidine-DNA glycosylase
MPELPDITVYIERLQALVQGRRLQHAEMLNAFVLRTALPPLAAIEGRRVEGVERLGKRVVLRFEGGMALVLHLMIAGRLRWVPAGGKPPGRGSPWLARLEFDIGSLLLTEAGSTRRASIHLLPDSAALAGMDPGGIDVFASTQAQFTQRLKTENHTLKRALTDPRLFSGIGNAYADEILHHARLSPVALTRSLPEPSAQRLFDAVRSVLTEWTERLRAEAAASRNGWPDNVTAFHPGMAVHGRYRLPCPVCGTPVQRIVHASNETNYCARCQTGGRLLADRALSTLLKASWPKTVDDL